MDPGRPPTIDDAAREAFRALRGALEFGGAALLVRDRGWLAVAATDPPVRFGPRATRYEPERVLAGWVLRGSEPRYIPDLQEEPRFHGDLSEGLTPGARTYLGAPLIADGDPVGVLHLDAPKPDAFDPADRERVLRLVPGLAASIRDLVPRPAPAPSSGLGDFLSIVSHELRAPITSIRGMSETLASRAETMDRALVEELARRISSAGIRLQRLVTDLLDLSSLERGQIPVRVAPVDVEPIIRQAVAIPTAPPHPVRLEIGPGLPRALADPDRLAQVLDNLIGNAAKFSDRDLPLTVAARMEGDRVAISVEDQGIGIPVELRERVFEPFARGAAEGGGDPGGIGIGLFIVRDICRAMDAEVRLESEVGVGTTVTILLPVSQPPGEPSDRR